MLKQTRDKHWLAFNKAWFRKNQNKLLWLLNTPFIGVWFRWCLGIRSYDCPRDQKVLNIEPNCFSYNQRIENGRWVVTTDFRTHWKYSKRLYFAFKPMWWIMHYMDEFFLDRFLPQYSWGFTTLTAYPDPNPETSTVDGATEHIDTGGLAFSSIVAAAGTNSDDTSAVDIMWMRADGNTDEWDILTRFLHLFDTSSIDSGDAIDSGVYSVWITAEEHPHGGSIVGCASNPASNTAVAAGDFDAFGDTKFTNEQVLSSITTGQYTNLTLNTPGKAAVDKDGITKLGIRHVFDIEDSAPTWISGGQRDQISAYFSDQTGSSNDPKLVLEHSVPAGGSGIRRLRSHF